MLLYLACSVSYYWIGDNYWLLAALLETVNDQLTKQLKEFSILDFRFSSHQYLFEYYYSKCPSTNTTASAWNSQETEMPICNTETL